MKPFMKFKKATIDKNVILESLKIINDASKHPSIKNISKDRKKLIKDSKQLKKQHDKQISKGNKSRKSLIKIELRRENSRNKSRTFQAKREYLVAERQAKKEQRSLKRVLKQAEWEAARQRAVEAEKERQVAFLKVWNSMTDVEKLAYAQRAKIIELQELQLEQQYDWAQEQNRRTSYIAYALQKQNNIHNQQLVALQNMNYNHHHHRHIH